MNRLIAVSCAVIFLDTAFFASLAPLLPDFKRELGLSTAEVGMLSGSYAAGVLLFALPGGWFAATAGAKRAVTLGLIGFSIFIPLFGFASSLWLLSTTRFIQGACGALLWAGAMAWVIGSAGPQRRGALIGVLVAAATVGEMLGAPIGAIADTIGPPIVFTAIGALSLALMLAAATLPKLEPSPPQPLKDVARAVGESHLIPAMLLVGAAAFAFGLATVVAPLRLDELGATAAVIALAFAAGSIVETIAAPLIGRLSDRVGRARPYQLGAAIGSAGILGLSLLDTRLAVFLGLVVFAFAAAMAFTPSMALAADSASSSGVDQGYASGLSNVAFGGGQMAGAVGGGLLAASGYRLPALVTVSILAFAAVTAGKIGAERPPATP